MNLRTITRLPSFVAAALVLLVWAACPAVAGAAREPSAPATSGQSPDAQAHEVSIREAAAPTRESADAQDDDARRYFAEPSDAQRRAAELFDAGIGAWRESRYARAEELWLAALDTIGAPPVTDTADAVLFDRHAFLFNLGNAAFRAERPLEAAGWYRAALVHQPRHAATHDNLELARQRAELDGGSGLEPTAAWGAYLAAWTPGEARWLALIGLGPLAVTLLIEALRGGRAALIWAGLALLLAVVLFAPLARHHLTADERPLMVIAPEGVALRSEARTGATIVARAAAGEDVLRRDALPEWIQVERTDGTLGWAPRADLFDLRR
jgi:tetratricopeptide (TPR) repeat protein